MALRTGSEQQSNGRNEEATVRPPHNLDAERGVLGAMILDLGIIPEVLQFVRGEDYYHAPHRVIHEAIVDIYDRGDPVDLTLLANDLRRAGKLEEVGGVAALAGLEQFTRDTGAAPELAQLVADKATLRRLMEAADTILRDSSEEKRDVRTQLDVAEKLIFEISQTQRSESFVPISSLMEEALEEIGRREAQQGDITGLPTGFIDLDRILNGLNKSDLIILAARPSIGKTAFAMNMMLNIALSGNPSGHPIAVGIFSLEMGKEQLNMRLLCSHARIPSHRVQRGLINQREFAELRAKASELHDLPMFIDDSPGLNLLQVRSRARKLKSQNPNLGLIVVDYLQLMSGSERGGREQNRQQEVSDISRGLKALARELQIPVLALSQLSRNIEQRSGKEKSARPMLSDLRESGAIEQDADVVMFVHRERLEIQKDEDGIAPDRTLPIDTEIIVGKHRNGPIGTAEILFFPDFTLFSSKQG